MLDLNDVKIAGSRTFSGRDRGEAARKRLEIERHDAERALFEVRIPDDTMSVNLSFFLGLFGPSVRRFGPDRFREKYRFLGRPVHLKSIELGIRRALLDTNLFDE